MDAAPNPAPHISGSSTSEPARWALMIRAFSHRNYRLFFGGQLVSLIGSFLTQVATPWLVYHVTNRVDLLGVVAFAGQIPMFLLAPAAGVWVDRWNRRRLLVITQTLSMIQSFGLAATALLLGRPGQDHAREIGGIIVLAVLQGLINAFDIPARQAFLVEMVDRREDLPNAIALNSTMVHGARFIGPAIGGVLISLVGPALCFFIDGVSYIGVIAALMAMTIKPRPPRENRGSAIREFRDGLRYIASSRAIGTLILLLTVLSLTGMPAVTTLMPVFARRFAGEANSARMLGVLMGASGLGAMVASVFLASRRSIVGLGRWIAIATVLFGLAIMAFGWSTHLWLSLVIIPFAGVGMLLSFASANTLIQTLTDDHMRGRVMSFFTMAFIGMSPWGGLLAGFGARALGGDALGASRTLLIAGFLVLLAGIAFAISLPGLRRAVRPIYIQKGIIVAPMVQGAKAVAQVMSGPER